MVTLDTTIADLYRQGSPSTAHQRYGHLACGGNSTINLTDEFPRMLKYTYQDSAFQGTPKHELTETNRQLRRSLTTKYLGLVTQREAFIVGDTTAVFFHTDPHNAERIEHDKKAAQTSVSVLNPSQRPHLVFCPGPTKIPMKEHRLDVLTCKLQIDPLEAYPMAVDLSTQYVLNTKESLARSGLPTPKCKVLKLEGYNSIPPSDCCTACKSESDGQYYIPASCTGPRNEWLSSQVDRTIAAIEAHPLPFVLKNQQSFGGSGVFLIHAESERSDIIDRLTGKQELLRKLFSQVTARNHHLSPGNILLSDMVRDPTSDIGLTLFVTDRTPSPDQNHVLNHNDYNGVQYSNDDGYIFMGASEQIIENGSRWTGNTISYPAQQSLHQKFAPLMRQIAGWCHSQGYFGPVGADVLETAEPCDTAAGRSTFQIVDLNVRTSGSMALPLLQTHFYKKRGLPVAGSFTLTTKNLNREQFVTDRFRRECESGEIVLLSWYQYQEDTEEEGATSFADGVVGAKDKEALKKLLKRIMHVGTRVRY